MTELLTHDKTLNDPVPPINLTANKKKPQKTLTTKVETLADAKAETQVAKGFTEGDFPPLDDLIKEILTTRRRHNSVGEIAFLKWLMAKIESFGEKSSSLPEGALLVEVGTGSKTMFSCHIDTMHSYEESNGKTQNLSYDPNFGHIMLDDTTAACLGADDGTGVYIMLRMIQAKVPGVYVFHRGEEVGCVSSRAIAATQQKWLVTFDACIAFDRADTYEVIITQGGQTCASAAYGTQLAGALTKQGLPYETSTRGVLTDSKMYRQHIRECINIGVGYNSQHGPDEYQDWDHLLKLTAAVIKIDWAALKPARVIDHSEGSQMANRFHQSQMGTHSSSGNGGYSKGYGGGGYSTPKSNPAPPKLVQKPLEDALDIDFEAMTFTEIEELVVDLPTASAIVRLVCELDAEKAKVKRLQMLLGF